MKGSTNLSATTFVLLGDLTLVEMICLKFWVKPLFKNAKTPLLVVKKTF